MTRVFLPLCAATVVLAVSLADAPEAGAQYRYANWQRFYYYPYYYFPHNYWPSMGPKYPEGPNEPYRRPPAYMAYPPFQEPNWRYEMMESQRFYRGFHFWLDQF